VSAAATLGNLVNLKDGLVSARVFGDPDLYPLELERVFARSWLFVAHESEIPRPGDFVTRQMGEDPVIVTRGTDGQIHVLLNVCRHRGRKVCGIDAGRAATFRCGYHGWTYTITGELTAVPFFEAYQGKLDKGAHGLHEARVGSYHGLIFATWDQDVESLDDYLGPLKWILDLTFGRTEAVDVAGPPVRWQAATDWKLGAANFTGDGLHVFVTHGFSTALGLHVLQTEGGPPTGYSMSTEHAHGASLVASPHAPAPYFGLPEVLWPEIERKLSPEQAEILKPLVVIAVNVFPNLSILETSGHTPQEWGAPDDRPMSFLTLRQWQPKGPGRMEGLSWLFLDRNAPEDWKAASKACYQRVFGVAGTFEQDDLANWAAITEGLRGPKAGELWLQFPLGLDMAPSPDWPGPGTAYFGRPPFFDFNERQFYAHWQELLMRE
jgi:phenylpropionate dioxygenase-like ring-hydroxylating dioxygenase large terminal subunit